MKYNEIHEINKCNRFLLTYFNFLLNRAKNIVTGNASKYLELLFSSISLYFFYREIATFFLRNRCIIQMNDCILFRKS